MKYGFNYLVIVRLLSEMITDQRETERKPAVKNEGNKKLFCEYCNKCFFNPAVLERHIRIHTGEKPFTCETCLQKFRQSGQLRSHQLTHSGEKPFSCETCLRKFSQSAYLRRHTYTDTCET